MPNEDKMPSVSVPAAIVGAGALGATAAIGSSLIQSSAASKAASQQVAAENAATQEQQNMFGTTQQNLQPFIQQGQSAANEVSALEGLNGGNAASIMNTLQQLPGYQFANYQGLKTVQNSATARGLGISGAAQKGAASYSTGLANEYYNNLLQGVQATENTGANAAAGLGNIGAKTGANIAGTTVGAGQAAAVGTLGSANALAGGLTGSANSLTNAFYTNQILGNLQNQNNGIYSTQNALAQQANYDFANQLDNNTALSTL